MCYVRCYVYRLQLRELVTEKENITAKCSSGGRVGSKRGLSENLNQDVTLR